MSTTQVRPSRVRWVNDVKGETHQLLREFGQEGKERAVFVKQNTSAVKLFLAESEKDRLNASKETMAAIKSKLQQLWQEEKGIMKDAHDLMRRIAEENKELAKGVKQFLTHSETERQATYETMMEGLHHSIRELRERTKEIRSESMKLLKQFGGENGTLKTEIKKFLSESEETRKKDYNKMMGEVRAVVNEIQAYEHEERRLAGAGTREVSGDVAKKKEITHEAKPEIKVVSEGKSKVEADRKERMFSCDKCGTQHWPFQKCPQGAASFKKRKLKE